MAKLEKPPRGVSMREIRRAAGRQKVADRLKAAQLVGLYGRDKPETKDKDPGQAVSDDYSPAHDGRKWMIV